jgi:hypothetical protein
MELRFADNFSVTLTTGKSSGTDIFTIPYVASTNLFAETFSATPSVNVLVPVTLVDSAGAVKAVGYAHSWTEYGTSPATVTVEGMSSVAAVAGDKLVCRLRADVLHEAAKDSFYEYATKSAGGAESHTISKHVKHTYIELSSATSLSIAMDAYGARGYDFSSALNSGNINTSARPGAFTVGLRNQTGNAVTLSFNWLSGSLRWPAGVGAPASIGTTNTRMLLEFQHLGGTVWLGRWTEC